MDNENEFKEQIRVLTNRINQQEHLISLYEMDGQTRAAYAINRKLNELADMMNKIKLDDLDLANPKDKTFERLKVAWGEVVILSEASKKIFDSAKLSGDEALDMIKTNHRISPESIADEIGELAGSRKQ